MGIEFKLVWLSGHIYLVSAIVAEEFLRSSASQITYHGLSELSSTLKDSQMGVLFRNNHFHTLLKHNVSQELVEYWSFNQF